MSRIAKIAVVASLIGLAAYQWFRASKPLTLAVSDFGIPRINGNQVTLPLVVSFDNSTPIPIPVDQVKIIVSYLRNGQFIQAASLSEGSFSIPAGVTNMTVYPTIDMRALFGNVLDTINTLANYGLNIRADISAVVKGITITDTRIKQLTV